MSAELTTYKCPKCDGAITFDANTQKLVCPYCGTELNVEDVKAFNAINDAKEDHFNWEEMSVEELDEGELKSYICDACGGEIIGDASMASASCPYCGNHVIVEKQLKGALKPNYIIPFKLDKKAAIAALTQHLKSKFLLPRDFVSEKRLTKIVGLYVPYWLFDCAADGSFRYQGIKAHTRRSGNYKITTTSYYLVYREADMTFEKIPVEAGDKIPEKVLESLEPYDFKALKPFNAAYLQGYLADRFDRTTKESEGRVGERIRNTMRDEVYQSAHGYLQVTPQSATIDVTKGRIAYALLPIWLLHTEYKHKKYLFAMNGQSGKFVGDLPLSTGRLVTAMLLTFILAFILAFALLWFVLVIN